MTRVALVRAAALGATLAFAAVVAEAAISTPGAMDFLAQYAAARLLASGDGSAVLDPAAVLAAERSAAPERERLLPFVQPPAVALLLSPLAALPFGSAFAVMAVIDVVALLIAILLLRRDAPLAAAALLALAPPAALAVGHGQTSPLVLLLVALAARPGAPVGGLALGLSLLRPQTAPLLILAGLIDPSRRLWALGGAVLVVIASAAVVGIDGLARYAATLVAAAEWSGSGEHGLRTSIGWSGPAVWLGAGELAIAASIASLLIGAIAVMRAPAVERVSVAALWSVLASPHALMHDGLLAYPIVLALAGRRAPWDAASAFAWMTHVLVAPLGVVWSLVLSVRTLGYARRA